MRREAFTLVEVVVATAVAALVAAAAVVALSSTFAGWTRLASGGALLAVDRALLRLERDVASAHPLPHVPFRGDATSLRIPLERGGRLVVAEWTAEAPGLVRRERDYRFNGEENYDGREADGRATAFRVERHRLPSPAAFAYILHAESGADDHRVADCAAPAPNNLPAAIEVRIPDAAVRTMPCRLRDAQASITKESTTP